MVTAAPRRPVPPSRARYEADHPAVTVRLDRATKDRLDKLREELGASFGDFMRRALGGAAEELEAAALLAHEDGVAEGLKRGRAEATRRYRLAFACAHCGQPVELRQAPWALKAMAALTSLGWGHGDGECPTRA